MTTDIILHNTNFIVTISFLQFSDATGWEIQKALQPVKSSALTIPVHLRLHFLTTTESILKLIIIKNRSYR